jgi:hypothetical protein
MGGAMINILSGRRFLAIYSGIVTVTFAITLLCGFVPGRRSQNFDEITAHRINIVEPDGKIRLVLTNKSSAPGVYVKNKEYPHGSRQSAGLYFFDDEGTEDGGLIYGVKTDSSGRVTGSYGHLSFDKYMQDQIFTIEAGREDHAEYSTLNMQDRGDYPIMDAIEANQRISKLPKEQQGAEWKKFMATHPGDHTRVVLGRVADGSAVLRLKDKEGHDRIVLRVAPDGSPKLQMLDAEGKVLSELPQSAQPGHP